MKVGSMFSGVGGLDLAVHALFPDAEPVWFFEWEDAPSAVLAQHWPDVPNHRDVTRWADVDLDPVDVMVGGFPCQDISHAGKGAGIKEGTRSGLWYRMADAIGVLRPRLVLLENVGAILANGGSAVIGSLAALGYDARWGVVRASDVGACHRRERWFCVAHPHSERGQVPAGGGLPAVEVPGGDGPSGGVGLTLLPTPAVNDMGRAYTPEEWDAWTAKMRAKHGNGNGHGKSLSVEAQRLLPTPAGWDGNRGPDLARAARPNSGGMDLVTTVERLLPTVKATNNEDRQSADRYEERGLKWGEYAAAIARWEHVLGRPAPPPTDDKGRLSPRFTEWMMGWPDGWTEPAGSRAKRLKACGNGVVSLQAFVAYQHLLGGVA